METIVKERLSVGGAFMFHNRFQDKNGRKLIRKDLLQFLDKQGFYIILALCIAIIGGTAWWSTRRNNILHTPQAKTETNQVKQQAIVPQQPVQPLSQINRLSTDPLTPPASNPNKATTSKATTDKTTANKTTTGKTTTGKTNSNSNLVDGKTSQTVSAPVKTTIDLKKIKLVMPVEGNIMQVFAMDSLVYSKTLKEWTTHKGLDISAKEGTEVKAALSGVVEKAGKDPFLGNVIVIDHQNGLKTFYGSLSTLDMVQVGQKVDRGQTISAVGMTAGSEILDESHLHFEVFNKDKSIDPSSYLIQ